MKQILFVLISVAFLAGCSKSGGDTTKPVVILNTPTGNQEFAAFSTVTISGSIADDDEIHEVHIIVTNVTNSSEVLHVHTHVDAKSYNINEVFTAQAATTYKIHVEADDHVGNTTVIEIQVKGI